MSYEYPTTDVARERSVGKGKREKSRDFMTSLEARLTQLELVIADDRYQIEDLTKGIDGCSSRCEEIRDDMLGVLHQVVDLLRMEREALCNEISSIRAELQKELEAVKKDIFLCKIATSQGVLNPQLIPRVDILPPKCFDRSRSARELDNFLWGLEQFYEASGMVDDAMKIKTTPLYLTDVATLWWRCKHNDIQMGTLRIDTSDNFKKKIKSNSTPGMTRWRRLLNLGVLYKT